jgi:hypothetical protein
MDRSNTLSKISALCRQDHWRAMFAIAWVTQQLQLDDLQGLLEALEEHAATLDKPGHYEAYRERWGRVPD